MPVIFIGLSGPLSAGKTTLAYLLRQIFPDVAFLLHADDFCKEFEDIPTVNGYLDCDGPDAVDFVRMVEVLDYMKEHDGIPPSSFSSWQDDVFPSQEEKALQTVSQSLVHRLQTKVQQSGLDLSSTRIVLVDGFLLYQNPLIRSKLDIRLFFRLSYEVAKQRMCTRPGYGAGAKPNESWKAEDYFDKMVWRNYVAAHARFFREGDVQGTVDEQECREAGILVRPGLDVPVEESLGWATREIVDQLKAAAISKPGL